MNTLKRMFFYLLCVIQFASQAAYSQGANKQNNLTYTISVFEDKNGSETIDNIIQKDFKIFPGTSPNYGLTRSTFWFKINLTNHSRDTSFLLKIQNASITNSSLYTIQDSQINTQSLDLTTPYFQRLFNSQYPLYYLTVPVDSSLTCYLRVFSENVMDLPITIEKDVKVLEQLSMDQWYFGIYAGIIFVMFLYNFFIFLSVRERAYLFYVFYILIVGLTQAGLKGYAAKFLWPGNEWLIKYAPHIITAASGIFSIFFTFSFLHVKKYADKIYYTLCGTIIVYFISIALYLSGSYITGQNILQVNTSLVSILILSSGFYIYKRGYKPALFFNISWSFFLGGVIIYILKDAGIFPVNNFTNNAILIGSGLEATFLSFALADRINILKKEKEASQAAALAAAQENERIIREQNVVLEFKVKERTMELIEANEELSVTLEELKDTQAQLVESEKMSSLGQLTAGIAHEINNPINFVTSNVAPLRRDVDMLLESAGLFENISLSEISVEEKKKQIEEYKEEIDFDYLKEEINHLLNGIHEGASRTAEIVKGLRIFSRVDEDDLKKADINEGLDSTLVIINNLLDNKIEVIKNYGNLPLIECYPGKLNQVFLNIITNGIHAVKQRHGKESTGWLKITTSADEKKVYIKIEDNGTGMDEHVMRKIFEPFFTTKEVGEGTGLGMSITYNTIKKHNGEIFVRSAVGEGTEFTLELPITHTEIQAEQND